MHRGARSGRGGGGGVRHDVVSAVLHVGGTVAVIIVLTVVHVFDDVFTGALLFAADYAGGLRHDVMYRGTRPGRGGGRGVRTTL